MERRVFLQVPGPTNIPDRILRVLSRPNVNSRDTAFVALLRSVVADLKYVFQTDTGDVLIFPATGSGGLEAVAVNLLNEGDKVLALCNGTFSERFATIAETFGAEVERLTSEAGSVVGPDEVARRLAEDAGHQIKMISMAHCETSTTAVSDVQRISELRKRLGHPALLMVDAISSLACIDLPADAWDIDVVVTGSQKGLMLPPGLAFVCVRGRAWDAVAQVRTPRWYWNFRTMCDRLREGGYPYTPAQTLIFGLRESLDILKEEGLFNTFRRHRILMEGVRAGVRAMGLTLLTPDEHASASVSAVLVPAQLTFADLEARMRLQYGVVIGGGLGPLAGKIFRIGHMGMLTETEVMAVLVALESALLDLGFPVEHGSGVIAARKAMTPQVSAV